MEGPGETTDEEHSKYAHVFNQVCEIINQEVDENCFQKEEVFFQLAECQGKQAIVCA